MSFGGHGNRLDPHDGYPIYELDHLEGGMVPGHQRFHSRLITRGRIVVFVMWIFCPPGDSGKYQSRYYLFLRGDVRFKEYPGGLEDIATPCT